MGCGAKMKKRKLALVIGVVVLLLAVLVGVLPFLLDLSRFQAGSRAFIEDALNRKVALDGLRLMILPRIGLRVTGFTVMDDPAFGAGPFASLPSVEVGVKLRPLLSKRVEVEEIVVPGPVITIIKNRHGVFNTSTLGKRDAPTPVGRAPASAPTAPMPEGPLDLLALLAVDRFSLTGGTIIYDDQSPSEPTAYRLQNLELLLKSVGLGQTPSLHLSTILQPMNLPVKLDGTFGPLRETPELDAIELALGHGKTVWAIQGSAVGGAIKLAVTSSAVNTADLPVTLPLKRPITLTDVRAAVEVNYPQIRVHDLSFNLFGGRLTSQGGFTLGPPTPPSDAKLTLRDIRLAPVLAATGMDGISISGTASAELTLRTKDSAKPHLMQTLEGTGHIVVKDGKVQGLDVLKETFRLLEAAGLDQEVDDAIVFSTIEGNVVLKGGTVAVRRFVIESRDFQATVTGTVGFDHALNLKAILSLSEPLSKRLAGRSPLTRLVMARGRITLPIIISGTTLSPAYTLDMKAVGATAGEQVRQTVDELLTGQGSLQEILQKGQEALEQFFGP